MKKTVLIGVVVLVIIIIISIILAYGSMTPKEGVALPEVKQKETEAPIKEIEEPVLLIENEPIVSENPVTSEKGETEEQAKIPVIEIEAVKEDVLPVIEVKTNLTDIVSVSGTENIETGGGIINPIEVQPVHLSVEPIGVVNSH